MCSTNCIFIKVLTNFREIKTIFGLLANWNDSCLNFKIASEFPVISTINFCKGTYSSATCALAPIKILGLVVSLPAREKCFLETRSTLCMLTFVPSSFQGKAAKVNCFGTTSSGSANSRCLFTSAPEISKHTDTTLMEMDHSRIFIIISKILRYIFHN